MIVTSMLFIYYVELAFKRTACLSQSTVSSVTQLHVSPTTTRAGCWNSAGSNQFFQTLGEKSSKNWLRKEMKKNSSTEIGSKKNEFETLFELLWPGFLTWSSNRKNRSVNTKQRFWPWTCAPSKWAWINLAWQSSDFPTWQSCQYSS